jgi:TRAP-type C4-dicarboxylate transport system permease small subunit
MNCVALTLLPFPQVFIGGYGLYSGINFLKLKAPSRNILEILTWLLLLLLVGFMVFWAFTWITMTSGHGPKNVSIMGAVMGVVTTGKYAVPLGIMLKFLRGDKVKNAMEKIA